MAQGLRRVAAVTHVLRFSAAIAAIVAVFGVDAVAGDTLGDAAHFLLLGIVVLGSAWFLGTGPALAATITGAAGATLPVLGVPGHAESPLHLALFIVQGLMSTALVSELRNARERAEREASVATTARQDSEAAGRMKDEFLAMLSHELRTPLNAVLGWVHLLRTGKLDQATTSRGLETIERNIRLQAQLTGDLLDVSKALTGKLQLESKGTALGDVATRAAESVEAAARARGVAIELEIPRTPVAVLADPERLRQVVWHLLANGIKFTPSGGTVRLRVDTLDRGGAAEARLVVEDDGPGIDPEFLPRVFQCFTQQDSSATRTVGGLGIGLALVRQLVELQGGEVEAANRPEGAGAVFTLRLPLQPASLLAPAAPPLVAMPPVASPPLNGLRVLVLDQDTDTREVVRTALQQRGATVEAVASVGDALELLEVWSPDILISDSITPEHNAYALVGKVQALDADRGGRIPAAALTNAARTDPRLLQLLADVHRDVPKPVEPSVLATEIARLTGRERRRAVR